MKNEEIVNRYKDKLLEYGYTEYLSGFLCQQLSNCLNGIDALNKSVSEIEFTLNSNIL